MVRTTLPPKRIKLRRSDIGIGQKTKDERRKTFEKSSVGATLIQTGRKMKDKEIKT
jgi:hypothetical protein